MNTRLRPELEKLIEGDVQRVPTRVSMNSWTGCFLAHAPEMWLPNTAQKSTQRLRKSRPLQRGELLDSDSVRRVMGERKTFRLSRDNFSALQCGYDSTSYRTPAGGFVALRGRTRGVGVLAYRQSRQDGGPGRAGSVGGKSVEGHGRRSVRQRSSRS